MIKAGKLRERAIIETDVGALRLGDGEPIAEWVSWHECWVELIPVSGSERWSGYRQVRPECTHMVRMRYRADMDTRKRMKIRGRTFNVFEVRNSDEEDKELLVGCVEEV